ncbi:MAG: DUF4166 domain-containing protein [Gammaproteobacteria bacterium]|nr:DUF4166 domain-containing protein [Gammaproteobacteria bacterium]
MFRKILSDQWELLSPAVQRHYGIEDGEKITLRGELAVRHGKFIKMLMPFIRLTGALVPVEGEKFKVTVKNKRVGDTFYWHRVFKKDNKVYEFNSKMQQFDNDIVEFVGLSIGIRMGLKVISGGLTYEDKGYVLKIGSKLISIPLGLLVGKSVIKEFTTNEEVHDIEMEFIVNHPWFGFGFSYMGFFEIIK